ncbi:hypothetical protein OQA88_3056 [Cercophora sp. LCS_1]
MPLPCDRKRWRASRSDGRGSTKRRRLGASATTAKNMTELRLQKKNPRISARLTSLPPEILYHILSDVDGIPDLASLTLVSHKMWVFTNPVLYAKAASDTAASAAAFRLAAEQNMTRTVGFLLTNGASPNIELLSPFLRSRLNDVTSLQGLKAGLIPCFDQHFAQECNREICVGNRQAQVFQNTVPHGDCLTAVWNCEGDVQARVVGGLRLKYAGTVNDMRMILRTNSEKSVASAGQPMYSWTPFHIAAHRGYASMVKLLLQHGASTETLAKGCCDCCYHNPGDRDCNTISTEPDTAAWHCAMCGGHTDIAKMLLRVEPATPLTGTTALHYAAWRGNLDLCKFLVEERQYPVDIPAGSSDSDGSSATPLLFAIERGHMATVGAYLIKNGANTAARWGEHNMLTYALTRQRFPEARQLLSLDPTITSDVSPITPIEACIMSLDPDCFTMKESPGVACLVCSWTCRHAQDCKLENFLGSNKEKQEVAAITQRLPRSAIETEIKRTLQRLEKIKNIRSCQKYQASALFNRVAKQSMGGVLQALVGLKDIPKPDEETLRACLRGAARFATSAHALDAIDYLLGMLDRQDCTLISWSDAFKRDKSINLAGPGVMEVRRQIAHLFHCRHSLEGGLEKSWPSVMSDIIHACRRPGGLSVSKQLAQVAFENDIFRRFGHNQLVKMFKDATVGPDKKFLTVLDYEKGDAHYDDVELAAWILYLAEELKVKDWLLRWVSLDRLARIGQFRVTQFFLERGSIPNIRPGSTLAPNGGYEHQMFGVTDHTYRIPNGPYPTIVHWICASPESEGAVSLLRCLFERVEDRRFFVNYVQNLTNSLTLGQPLYFCTAVSVLARYRGNREIGRITEAELEILKILDSEGPEYHGAIQSKDPNGISGCQLENLPFTTRQNMHSLEPSLRRRQSPIAEAINRRKHEFLRVMLSGWSEISDSPALTSWAFKYVALACGAGTTQEFAGQGWGLKKWKGIPCPETLSAVLESLDISDIDMLQEPLIVNTDRAGSYSILQWLLHSITDRTLTPVEQVQAFYRHGCSCSDERKAYRRMHLVKCIRLLMEHGARWVRKPIQGSMSQHPLRNQHVMLKWMREDVLPDCRIALSDEVHHNLEELTRHIVLRWEKSYEESLGPDFNPFEFGPIKANWGTLPRRLAHLEKRST